MCAAQHVSSIRAKIRDGHPDYIVTAYSWPLFLYAGFKVHIEDMERGLFRSELLVKVSVQLCPTTMQNTKCYSSQAYKHVFTSPTSATIDEQSGEQRPKRRKLEIAAKRAPVATAINLRSVTPRSIAYIATQVSSPHVPPFPLIISSSGPLLFVKSQLMERDGCGLQSSAFLQCCRGLF
jgi:hypothetical protein